MNTIECRNDESLQITLSDPQSVDRYVVRMARGDTLKYAVTWGEPAKIRVICQDPGGAVLHDEINQLAERGIFQELTCELEGAYSFYVMPLIVPHQNFTVKLTVGPDRPYGPGRRLPIFFIIDCSKTMDSASAAYVREVLPLILEGFRGDPQLIETAYLSCIAFDSTAFALSPLTELFEFKIPVCSPSPREEGDISAAVRELKYLCETQVVRATEAKRGDWKPLVFIFSNCLCPSGWDDPILWEVRRLSWSCAVFLTSEKADAERAKRLSESVVGMLPADEAANAVYSFCRSLWVS